MSVDVLGCWVYFVGLPFFFQRLESCLYLFEMFLASDEQKRMEQIEYHGSRYDFKFMNDYLLRLTLSYFDMCGESAILSARPPHYLFRLMTNGGCQLNN